jgi:hypothetical protein
MVVSGGRRLATAHRAVYVRPSPGDGDLTAETGKKKDVAGVVAVSSLARWLAPYVRPIASSPRSALFTLLASARAPHQSITSMSRLYELPAQLVWEFLLLGPQKSLAEQLWDGTVPPARGVSGKYKLLATPLVTSIWTDVPGELTECGLANSVPACL